MNNWANGFDPAVHIDKLEATIAQQQARIEELVTARAGQLTPQNMVTLQQELERLEQALAAERERAKKAERDCDAWRDDYLNLSRELQAERKKSASLSARIEAYEKAEALRQQPPA